MHSNTSKNILLTYVYIIEVDQLALTEFSVRNLRDFQRDAISSVMESRDTVVRVPTGSGKSLIFWVSHVAW